MNKSYYSILISQTTTNLGFSLYTMSVILFLYHLTHSPFLTSLVTLVSILVKGTKYIFCNANQKIVDAIIVIPTMNMIINKLKNKLNIGIAMTSVSNTTE
ncbi:hypothetical protein A3863_18160 [Priestia endophytica]|uniref:Uncharacterized protein n=1 Tax=Priestia endophytica TaxID=135735 RepID=A0AAX1QE27_9BACI|nr:hypothetical protein A3864_08705 [Priestia endophytica]RAS86283.1 hypothetical protein A3863_18160 [Priestia endophytica]